MHGQDIEISLDKDAPVLADYLTLGEINAVERGPLVIDLRLGRIDIFSDVPLLVVRPESSATEADNPAADRVNREHCPLPELVHEAAVIALYANSRSDKVFRLVSILNGFLAKSRTLHRRPSEPVFLNGGIFETPAFEIGISKAPALLGLEAFLKELFSIVQNQHQALPPLPGGYFLRCLFFLPDFNAVFLRKIFQCLDIAH